MLTDVHAHICDEQFDDDRDEALRRAQNVGITRIIAVGENIEDARKNLTLAQQYSAILPAAGLYPTIIDVDQALEMVRFIRDNRSALAAIGEVGLDFWKVKDDSEREVQREIFSMFIALSEELALPLNVHSRSAGRHVIDMLLESGATRVLLHAFDAKAATALRAVEAGYYFSIPPSIVRSRQKQKLVKQLPLSSIMFETDSPVLGPEANVRNEPANLVLGLKAVAEIKGIDVRQIQESAIENTSRLFPS